MRNLVKIWNIGKIPYGSALKVQKYLVDQHQKTKDVNTTMDTLLLVEHNPVYTIGIRTKDYSKEEEDRLIKLGAEFFRTNRGGLITFHGPGQLVVYPILNLKNYKPSIRWYVCQIEQTIINMCSKLNIDAKTSSDTGVWVGNNKICAIGLRGSKFITMHGLAINCNTNLHWFEHIVPCGIPGKGVTSISQELKTNFTIKDAVPYFLDSFSEIFKCSYCDYDIKYTESILKELNIDLKNNK